MALLRGSAVAAMMDNEPGPRKQPLMGRLFDDEEIVGQRHIVGRAGPPWIQKHAEPLRSVYEGIQHRFPVESDRAAESRLRRRVAFGALGRREEFHLDSYFSSFGGRALLCRKTLVAKANSRRSSRSGGASQCISAPG